MVQNPCCIYRLSKRAFDITFAFIGLLLASPVLLPVLFLVLLLDKHNPVYAAVRTGKYGTSFRMFKVRSMIVDADKAKVWATATDDNRITPVGRLIRACKFDELPQLWNVLIGDMSFVGPRPLAPDETAVYTTVEKQLLSVRPGITDIASIVFADEGEILSGSTNPTEAYNRIIRPWKSRFGLLYVSGASFTLDILLIIITITTIINRQTALRILQGLLPKLGADNALISVALRKDDIPIIDPTGQGERI